MVTTYVVECASCGQGWAVDRPLTATADHPILLPYHTRVVKRTGVPGAIPCIGAQMSGRGAGTLTEWEREWPRRNPGWTLPRLLDGSAVRVGG